MQKMNDKIHIHPLTTLIRDAHAIFHDMGFDLAEGPEIESERYNFDLLNVPKDHPARDMQDTFFVAGTEKKVLRTHTSPVQIRYMETHKPPLRVIVPGKVFRNEATDRTHEAQFYQIEGLAIDTDITLGHLKGVLQTFISTLMGKEVSVRFRPSFFPFVEPGVEVDVSCFKCSNNGLSAGCSLCKQTGWIELLGAGMVHPKVLAGAGINPKVYQGFAFGVGLERLGMLKYGIDDARLFASGDLRFINQF